MRKTFFEQIPVQVVKDIAESLPEKKEIPGHCQTAKLRTASRGCECVPFA